MAKKAPKFDVAEYFDTPEAAIEYLNAALETGDADFIVKAIGDVARAKGAT